MAGKDSASREHESLLAPKDHRDGLERPIILAIIASFLKRINKETGPLTHEHKSPSLRRRVLSFKHDADPYLQNGLDRAPEPTSLPLPHPKSRLLAQPSLELTLRL